jgi:aryl-alcohol dehydrogenase-like predicted oxidoreductase
MGSMRYGTIPGLDKPVSRLVQGIIQVDRSDEAKGFSQLDAAFASGITCVDTAYIYGSDPFLGKWMQTRGNRDQVVVLAKCAHPTFRNRVTPYDIQTELHDILVRLGTDHVDMLVLHRDDEAVPVGPIVDVLNVLVKQGKVKAFGGSNWTTARLQEANDYAASTGQIPFAVSSPNFSLADPIQVPWGGCITISGDAQAAERDWYTKAQMPVFSWSSMAGGFWSGRYTRDGVPTYTEGQDKLVRDCYCSDANFERLDRASALGKEKGLTVAQVALAWILNDPMDVYALVGAQTQAEIDANLGALETVLTPGERAWLDLKADSPNG